MSTVGQRFKEARKHLGYSRKELGDKLGTSESVIVNIEYDRLKNPQQKEPFFKFFCNECGINYLWLMDGIGNPVMEFPKTILDDLARTYNLTDTSKELVNRFINMSVEEQAIIAKLFSPIKKSDG